MKTKLTNRFETTIYKWDVKGAKHIVQIVHGSGEHAKRYEHFAKWLNKNGIAVWAIDLRGHGQMESDRNNLGYFGPNGKEIVINDVNLVGKRMKKEYPNATYTLLGHSMGSFIVRMVALKYSNIDNLIAIGTNHQPRIKSMGGYLACKIANLIMPSKHTAKFLDKLSYKTFDKKIKAKESGEWLSENKKNRESFKKDPLNGFIFTENGFVTMSYWVNIINSRAMINTQDKTKRVLFLAGQEDPVGNLGIEPIKANKAFVSAGIDSKVILYKGMRHEILNETKRIEVYKDILKFITKEG